MKSQPIVKLIKKIHQKERYTNQNLKNNNQKPNLRGSIMSKGISLLKNKLNKKELLLRVTLKKFMKAKCDI